MCVYVSWKPKTQAHLFFCPWVPFICTMNNFLLVQVIIMKLPTHPSCPDKEPEHQVMDLPVYLDSLQFLCLGLAPPLHKLSRGLMQNASEVSMWPLILIILDPVPTVALWPRPWRLVRPTWNNSISTDLLPWHSFLMVVRGWLRWTLHGMRQKLL